MIKVRPAKERGMTQTGWLESRHTFSFNRYYNREYSGFRDLLVINEDLVEPAQGFGTHSHDNMEILSYVVDGAIEHRDSTGASGVLRPNELQRMSAGTGVTHSEFNPSKTEKSHFLQIWIVPEREGIRPEYEQRAFPEAERAGRLRLIGSPDGRGATVRVHQDVLLYDSLLKSGETRGTRNRPKSVCVGPGHQGQSIDERNIHGRRGWSGSERGGKPADSGRRGIADPAV